MNDGTELQARLEQLFEEFEHRRMERMEVGAQEYGRTTFMENDVFAMIYEEFLDIANYAAMLYAKLRILEETLASSLDTPDTPSGDSSGEQLSLGFGSFTPGGQSPV